MKKIFVLLGVLCLALGACASPATSQPPTATLPPPTHTPTLQPTATTIPTNTPTLASTATSKLTATTAPTSTPEVGMEEDVYLPLTDIAYNNLSQGDVELAQLILTEMLSYPVSSDQKIHLLLYRGFMQGCLGDYEAANADLLKVIELDPPDTDIQTNAPYWLCRYYGLSGQPELALPYCEQSVQVVSNIDNVEALAMIHAQLGKYEDASINFQNIIDAWGTPEDEASKQGLALRQTWLKQLEAGQNPFTPNVLQAEQEKKCPVPSAVGTAPKPATRVSLQKIFEDIDMFSFYGITDSAGQEAVQADSIGNFGSANVILLGPKNSFEGMLLQMQGGTPDYRLYLSMPLLETIFPNKTERAQAIVWLLAGAKLFEGTATSTEGVFTFSIPETETLLSTMESSSGWSNQKHIGDFTLSAETSPEQNDVFRIVIVPTK